MPPKVPSWGVELHNESAAYSPENAASPVYQLLIPGRPTRLTVLHGEERAYRADELYRADLPYRGLASYTLASGAVDDIHQTTTLGAQRVGIDSLGTMSMLVGQNVTVAVQTSIRTDQAISLLLDAAGWPTALRSIAIGDTTLLYWWCDERSPWTAILELLAAEGPCQLYQTGDGVIHFENRNYRSTAARSSESQATFLDRDDGPTMLYREDRAYSSPDLYRGGLSSLWFTALAYAPGYKQIFNRATYSTKRRTLGALATIWQYGADLSLSASQSITLIAKPTDPFQNAVTPALTTDYTVAGGTVSVSLSATSGLVAFITVTATSGAPTVSALKLRAQPLTVVSETAIQNSVDASASIAKYSPIPGANIPRTLQVQAWPEVDPAMAEAVCNAWVNRYQEQRPQVSIVLRNADADHVRQILDRQVSDRITLVDANTGLSGDVWVETKSTTISGAGGRVIACELGCEKVEELSGAVWDVSLWDNPSAVWGV